MNRIAVLGAVAAAFVLVPLAIQLTGSGGAQPADTASAQSEREGPPELPGVAQADEALILAQMRLQELQRELQGIQAEVLEENEEFSARSRALDQRLLDRMEAVGYEGVGEDLREIEEVLERLEAGEISEPEAEAALEARADVQQRLQQAHDEALRDEEFAEELAHDRRALADDVLEAMHEKDARTAAIIEELDALEQQLIEEWIERQGQAPAAGDDLPQ
jgi:hypothetical protein